MNNLAQKQKTALQKLTREILSKEDLPAGVDYKSILGEVTLNTVSGYFDNLLEKEFEKIPIIGAVVDLGFQIYKEKKENIENRQQITSKNQLVNVINELADEIDKIYDKGFTIKTMNLIADEVLPLNLTSDFTEYLFVLQKLTDNYTSSVPSSDQIYIRTLESLLNYLNSQNPKYGKIRIGIDYRNIQSFQNLLISDFDRKPSNVSISITDGPYKSRIMNAINDFVDRSNFSVLELKVNKYVICHINFSGKLCTVKIGNVNPDYSLNSFYEVINSNIYFWEYFNGNDYGTASLSGNITAFGSLMSHDLSGGGAPATTKNYELLNAAYNNVWSNSSIYRKFKP